jgi:hypothetical protein
MGRRKEKDLRQLSLFESNEPPPEILSNPKKEPTVVDFVRARFEANPEMNQEEYKRWIKILVNSSLKRMG